MREREDRKRENRERDGPEGRSTRHRDEGKQGQGGGDKGRETEEGTGTGGAAVGPRAGKEERHRGPTITAATHHSFVGKPTWAADSNLGGGGGLMVNAAVEVPGGTGVGAEMGRGGGLGFASNPPDRHMDAASNVV